MTAITIARVSIADITFDKTMQFRTFTDGTHIQDLASVYAEFGKYDEMPTLTREVTEEGEVIYRIKDGTHRILGAKESGAEDIEVCVEDVENAEEAMFAAMSVNTKHGKALTVADLELILKTIKESSRVDEFKKNAYAWNKKALLAFLGCAPRMLDVAVVKTSAEFTLDRDMTIAEMTMTGMTANAIGKALGVDGKTVRTVIDGLKAEEEVGKNAEDEKIPDTTETSDVADLSDCPFDIDGDECVLGMDDDDEDMLSSATDELIESLSRRDEKKVVTPDFVIEVDVDEWLGIFEAMTPEQKAVALKQLDKIR